MPVVRDPDGFLYYKEEVGASYGRLRAKSEAVNVDPIPDRFEFSSAEDWDHSKS